jgi:hypothetical protein
MEKKEKQRHQVFQSHSYFWLIDRMCKLYFKLDLFE